MGGQRLRKSEMELEDAVERLCVEEKVKLELFGFIL